MKLTYAHAMDYISGDSFQVWQCIQCQTGITTPQPVTMAPYYPRQYRRYIPLIGKVLKFFYRRRVKHWASQFPGPGMAFEMGCGDGLMLDTLRDLGWKVVGSERTPQAAYYAHYHLRLPVFVGGLETIQPGPHFDLIFLFQVLEHLADPLVTVQRLSQLLRPGGKLIIGVPNFSSWQSKVGQEKWFHLDVPRHLRHYSLRSLQVLLNQSSMEIELINYVSFEHDFYGWVQTILNRLDGSPNRLTRLLMRLTPPDPMHLLHFAAGSILGILLAPLTILSWVFKQGGMIEITARKVEGS